APGAGAQIFPTVAAQQVLESGKPYVYVGWLDTAASGKLGPANANAVYDARYRLSTGGGLGFGRTVLAADHASTSDFGSVGDRLSIATSTGAFHFAWTDNRSSFSPFFPRQHIAADRN